MLTISNLINKDLTNTYVRVEVISDKKGFGLNHTVLSQKKLVSCLLFINKVNESENLSTDFYKEKLEKVKTIPYKNNYGYFFTSCLNTWNGKERNC